MNTNTRKNLLITGANRGIGYGILRNLIKKSILENKNNQNLSKNNFPYNIILTSRTNEKCEDSLKSLKNEFPEFPIENYFLNFPLDISNTQSIIDLSNSLKEKNIKLDILLNNAGVNDKKEPRSLNTFNYIFSTNLFGTIEITENFLKENIFNKNSKIINVSSKLGKIQQLYSEELKELFRKKTAEKDYCYFLAEKYRKAIESNNLEQEGWIDCYHVSKMILNKFTEILAEDLTVKENEIQVYACHPGWVRTDMGGANADLSIDDGCVTPIYLVELEHKVHKEFQGRYFNEKKEVDDCGL
jgi:short-subunit dehydrogenase